MLPKKRRRKTMNKVSVIAVIMLCLSGFAWADVVTINGGIYRAPSGGVAYTNNGNDVTASGADFDGTYQTPAFVNNGGTLTANDCTFEPWQGIVNIGGRVTINGGVISGSAGGIDNNSGILTVNSGRIRGGINSRYGCSTVIYGGDIDGISNGISSTVTIYGGHINGLYDIAGTATIYGGDFTGTSGMSPYGIWQTSGIPITIYGTFAQYGTVPHGYGTITGTLADGTNETFTYEDDCGSIILAQSPVVPEPSSILALLCGIGGMGGMVLRKRSA
jgi:hypothetical protein